MNVPRTFVASALAACVAAWAPRAAALTCAERPDDVAVPRAGTHVPRNVRPKLLRLAATAVPRYQLVCSVEGGASDDIEVDQRHVGDGPALVVELAPKRLLTAGASCAIVSRGKDTRTWFVVEDRLDERAPRFAGVGRSQVQPSKWDGALARAELAVFGLSDDGGGLETLLLGIWRGKGLGEIDYARAPTSWVQVTRRRGQRPTVLLSEGGDCASPSLDFPEYGERARIGLRAVDLAGNVSPAVEGTVDGYPSQWLSTQLTEAPAPLWFVPSAEFVPAGSRSGVPIWWGVLVLAAVAAGAALWLERDR